MFYSYNINSIFLNNIDLPISKNINFLYLKNFLKPILKTVSYKTWNFKILIIIFFKNIEKKT